MTNHEGPGVVCRLWTALGSALQRGILGNSARSRVRHSAHGFPEPEFEPVHGWTKRQLIDYLAHNPGYESTYEAALQEHRNAAVPAVIGAPLAWFGPWRWSRVQATGNTGPKGPK